MKRALHIVVFAVMVIGVFPASAQAIEYAQPGIHISNDSGEGATDWYTTTGEEYVKHVDAGISEPSPGVYHHSTIDVFYAPNGIKALNVYRDGKVVGGSIDRNNHPWGIGYKPHLSTTPSYCSVTLENDEGELWKIVNDTDLACGTAKVALDYYLENERSPAHYRCRMHSDTQARCWRKGHRATMTGKANETSRKELSDAAAHRAKEVVYCGDAGSYQGGYRVYTRARQDRVCDSFDWAAGRIATAHFVYGAWTYSMAGWNCNAAPSGVRCYQGSDCAYLIYDSQLASVGSDGDGKFWWSPSGSPC